MAIHNFFKVASVLPALLVMPAMAESEVYKISENIDLGTVEQFANGQINGGLYSVDGFKGTLTTPNITIVGDAKEEPYNSYYGVYVNNNGTSGSEIVLGETGTTESISVSGADRGAYAEYGGLLSMNAGTINVESENRALVAWDPGSKINITGNDVTLTSTGDGYGAMAIAGAQLDITAENVNISSNYAGLHAQNNTIESNGTLATANITADNIIIEGDVYAVGAMSQGVVNLVGNTTLTGQDAILARGNATVNVNTAGDKTVVMNGDVDFNFYGPSNSNTLVDADVNVTLAGTDSVWNGNTVVNYDMNSDSVIDDVDPAKLVVTGAALTLKDGAVWNATKIDDVKESTHGRYYTALNKLTITDGGTVNIQDTERGITVESRGVNYAVNMSSGANANALISGGILNVDATNVEKGRGIKGNGTIDVDELIVKAPKGAIYATGNNGGLKINATTIDLDANSGISAISKNSVDETGKIVVEADYLTIKSGAEAIKTGNKGIVDVTVNKELVINAGTKDVLDFDERATALEAVFGDGDFTLSALGKATINGDIYVGNDGTLVAIGGTQTGDKLTLTMTTADSSLTGAVKTLSDGVSTIDFGAATWNVTDDSNLTNLVMDGGSIKFNGFNVQVDNVNANNAEFDGGITVNNSGTISNSEFNGGAIANSATLTLTGVSFNGNEASVTGSGKRLGGAIYNDGTADNVALVTISDGSEFIGNKANYAGGAIYNAGNGTLDIANASFNGNESLYGGAINNSGVTADAIGTMTITESEFKNNIAKNGGAIRNQGDASFVGMSSSTNVISATFLSNQAENGGAVWNGERGTMEIENAVFTSNIAKGGLGQGAAITNNGKLTISGENTFTSNTADTAGGAIFNDRKGDLTFSGTNTFTGNVANGIANDIHNIATITIADGTTSISGGITGDTGAFTVKEGATLNIGTSTIVQDKFVLDGFMNASILKNGRDGGTPIFAKIDVNDLSGTGTLNLNISSEGEYDMFLSDVIDTSNPDSIKIQINGVYDWKMDGGKLVVTTKKTEQIAQETGLTESSAAVFGGLTKSSNTSANNVGLAVQEILADTSAPDYAQKVAYVESEMSKANPGEAPVSQSIAMGAQNTNLNLSAGRMNQGRTGGDAMEVDYGMWAQGLFNKSKLNDQFHGYTRGVAVGLDALIEKEWTVGLGASFNNTTVHANTGRTTDIDTTSVFMYAQYQPTEWYINATLNYIMSDYTENVVMMGLPLQSDYDTDAFGGQIMTGYELAAGFTPEMGVRYLHIDGYNINNGLNNVNVDASDYLTGIAGMRYAFNINSTFEGLDGIVVWRPELRAAATYDFLTESGQALVTMPGLNPYLMGGERLSRFGGEFGLGLSAIYNGLEISVNYELDLHEDYTSQTGMVKFRYDF